MSANVATSEVVVRLPVAPCTYLILFASAQASLALGAAPLGTLLQVGLVLALVCYYVANPDGRWIPVVPGLLLLSLTVLTALATTSAAGAPSVRAAVVGPPLLAAVVVALRRHRRAGPDRPRADGTRRWTVPALVALSEVLPAPYLAEVFRLQGMAGWVSGTEPRGLLGLAAAALLAVAFVGVYEELLFRGLLFETFEAVHPRLALPATTGLFALAYLGAGSLAYTAAAAAVGAVFGWLRQRTGQLAGVAAAHSIMSVLILVVVPAVGPAVGPLWAPPGS